MLFRNKWMKYYDEAGADGADAGGAGGEPEKMFTMAEVREMIAKETSGLKSKNVELLGKIKAKSESAEAESAERRRLEQETAKRLGEMEALERSIREQEGAKNASILATLEKRDAKLIGAEKKAIMSSLAVDFIDAEGVDLIGHMVSVELDDDGNTVTKFTGADGQLLTTDPAEFKKIMRNNKAIARLLKADDTNGGGAQGGKGGDGKAAPTNDAMGRLQERLRKQKLM